MKLGLAGFGQVRQHHPLRFFSFSVSRVFFREPPGWLAGPGDRGGLGLGHGSRSHIEFSGDTRWGRDQHDRREDAQSNLSARESHCWELICLLKLIPLRLNLSKLMFSLSFPPCHQLRNTQVSLKRWYLKEWIWTTVIYHSKTMTHKYEAYMQGAQLDYCIWGEKRRTPRVEMQKAENRFVLIIHPPVLILGPNGVFLR